MKIYNSYTGMKNIYPKLVLALGNFDGVHQGHRRLLRGLIDMARQLGATPAVFTFSPHPMQVLKPEFTPPLLLSDEDKKAMIADLGVEVLFCIPFTGDFSSIPPEAFIRDILVKEIGAKGILVGYNYHFGRDGQGDTQMLARYADQYGYILDVIPPVQINGQTVSSTLIRGLMQEGKVEEAGIFLGYRPFIRGCVVAGDQRGRTIGFPTANLDLPGEILVPAGGVYAVMVEYDGRMLPAVANIGCRPTFQTDVPVKNLEVHIFDFNDDIYGKTIRVEFVKRLRAELKFASPGQLVDQMAKDKALAGEILRGNKAKPEQI